METNERPTRAVRRVSLELPPLSYVQLLQQKQLLGTSSQTEVVVRALRLMDFLSRSVRHSQQLQLVDKKGEMTKIELLF